MDIVPQPAQVIRVRVFALTFADLLQGGAQHRSHGIPADGKEMRLVNAGIPRQHSGKFVATAAQLVEIENELGRARWDALSGGLETFDLLILWHRIPSDNLPLATRTFRRSARPCGSTIRVCLLQQSCRFPEQQCDQPCGLSRTGAK